ncbi:hypothetical protein [Streptomyces sp. NBC_01233]|uniref:hypothetical protein n=1 Tax=Streptomyces sp. NBC_01233 TaxID=2903787 RepID=UPI002E167642|nr:hypothetical protein OG332_28325 [Streptomyces sp. NBC_01233]
MPLEAVVALIVVTVIVVALVALLSAAAAVLLARSAGASRPSAFMRGGVTFGATLTLLALLSSTVAGLLR